MFDTKKKQEKFSKKNLKLHEILLAKQRNISLFTVFYIHTHSFFEIYYCKPKSYHKTPIFVRYLVLIKVVESWLAIEGQFHVGLGLYFFNGVILETQQRYKMF